jgi:octaprenyl-diphosphate synthase
VGQNTLLAHLKSEAVLIDKVIADDLRSVTNVQLQEILGHALLSGGKRIRPLLTILSARLCRKKNFQDEKTKAGLYRLAISFEYLHAASLLHDDVIDHADVRRGRPAVNSVWGNTPAILAGDYLHSRAMYLAGTIGGEAILAQISTAAASMVEAEFIQMRSVITKDQSEESYFSVLEGKTAALISAACETGAMYAGEKGKKRAALKHYGRNLGLAFQIIDDLLDYLGDSNTTGKAVGNDFIEGKMTLPLISALKQSTNTDREMLASLLDNTPQERKKNLPEAGNIIAGCDGFVYAGKRAAKLIEEAATGLDLFQDSSEKEILLGLGQYVLKRNK